MFPRLRPCYKRCSPAVSFHRYRLRPKFLPCSALHHPDDQAHQPPTPTLPRTILEPPTFFNNLTLNSDLPPFGPSYPLCSSPPQDVCICFLL